MIQTAGDRLGLRKFNGGFFVASFLAGRKGGERVGTELVDSPLK
jgi:hypothetical protein